MQQRYKTRQRHEILAFLSENAHACFSPKELRLALSERGVTLGQTTVYRTLMLLEDEGLVVRFAQGEGRGASYQYAEENPSCRHHLHFKCRDCGELYHLECKKLTPFISHLKQEHGFSFSQADTVLYGVCKTCSGEAK